MRTRCVSERLNFEACLATKLRLFLLRFPAGLAERSIDKGFCSFLAESSFFGFELEFFLDFLGHKKFLDLLGYRNIVNTMELEQQPNASVLD